jgi:hypothetical protein
LAAAFILLGTAPTAVMDSRSASADSGDVAYIGTGYKVINPNQTDCHANGFDNRLPPPVIIRANGDVVGNWERFDHTLQPIDAHVTSRSSPISGHDLDLHGHLEAAGHHIAGAGIDGFTENGGEKLTIVYNSADYAASLACQVQGYYRRSPASSFR